MDTNTNSGSGIEITNLPAVIETANSEIDTPANEKQESSQDLQAHCEEFSFDDEPEDNFAMTNTQSTAEKKAKKTVKKALKKAQKKIPSKIKRKTTGDNRNNSGATFDDLIKDLGAPTAVELIDGKRKMSFSDYIRVTEQLKRTGLAEKVLLLQMYNSKSYEIAYTTFKAFVEAELTISYDAAFKQALAASKAYEIGGLEAVGRFSDASMLGLIKLTKEECYKVIRYLKEEYLVDPIEDYSLTAKQVKEAVLELYPEKVKPSKHDKKLDDLIAKISEKLEKKPLYVAVLTTIEKEMDKKQIKNAIKYLKKQSEKK